MHTYKESAMLERRLSKEGLPNADASLADAHISQNDNFVTANSFSLAIVIPFGEFRVGGEGHTLELPLALAVHYFALLLYYLM